MAGKYESFRDSALHFLCESGWGNGSLGDVNDFGVFIWKISNAPEDVQVINTEATSVLEDWNYYGEADGASQEFRDSLVGHFIVSENSDGLVSVRKFNSEVGMLDMFHKFQVHYDEWVTESIADGTL